MDNFIFHNPTRLIDVYKRQMEFNDVERIRQAVPEVEVINPNISRWGSTAIFGDKKSSCAVRGLQPDYEKIEAQNITMGRFINDVDILESRKVCTIGKRVYDELFPQGGNPCGQYLRVDGIYYQIVGVSLSTSNMNINAGTEDSVTLPFTTMQKAYNFGKRIDLVCITVKPGVTVTSIADKIEQVIKKAHYIHPDDKQAVIMVNAEAMFSMIDNLFTGIKILAWMVGLGTLLAGAIGGSNICLLYTSSTRCVNGKLLTKGGTSYKAIIIPAVKLMPSEVLGHLLKLAQAGATIIFTENYPQDVHI